MHVFHNFSTRTLLTLGALSVLTACSSFDPDLRNNFGNSFDTSGAVRQEFAPRPEPDDRGVISYPGYQVVVARRGDTIVEVANRIGVDAASLSQYNAISPDAILRDGEIIALPDRVAEPSAATGMISTGALQPATGLDVETIASDAIDRAGGSTTTQQSLPPTGKEPVRHRVEPGETAYSVARLYNVSIDALAEWNGLDSNLTIRSGQYLLIPVATETVGAASSVSRPGAGSATPTPPSAAQPLPQDDTVAGAETTAPASPDLSTQQSSASQSELLFPVNGNIIRPFEAGGNSGIDISAAAGATVKAAKDGTIAAITQDTENVPVLVIRHADNLLTVYANIANISVEKGQSVSRGQKIAEVPTTSPSFIRFEVRRGIDAVDPMPLLN